MRCVFALEVRGGRAYNKFRSLGVTSIGRDVALITEYCWSWMDGSRRGAIVQKSTWMYVPRMYNSLA
jgi:hypothetical protein